MKTRNLFAFAALALSFSLAACDSYQPVVAGSEIQSGDRACRIESFTLNLGGDVTIRGDVYDYDKTIDVLYDITQVIALGNATATVTLSEGASISPNPAEAKNYLESQSFTVTAPDGKTKRTYTTIASEKIVETYTKVTPLGSWSALDLGIDNATTAVGVSGGDVVVGTKVFDGKTLAAKGDLNVTGLDGKPIIWLTNDDAGHLVGSTVPEGNYASTGAKIFVWKDGWNAAPTLYLGPSTQTASFLSAKGNLVEGIGRIICAVAAGTGGRHYVVSFEDGVRLSGADGFTEIVTGINGYWTQQVSPCSTDISGQWFLLTAGNGADALVHGVKTWTGWNGTTNTTPSGMVDISGAVTSTGWGNHRVGSICAFTFNGTPMAMVATKGWPTTYLTIVDAEGNFILNPNDAQYAKDTVNFDVGPRIAYYYNESDGYGYVYVFENTVGVYAFKLEIAIL